MNFRAVYLQFGGCCIGGYYGLGIDLFVGYLVEESGEGDWC